MTADDSLDSAANPAESATTEIEHPAIAVGAGLFPVVAMAGIVFCLSVLTYVAAAFGDARSPVNQWINRNGTAVILAEVVLLMLVCGAAMTVDRIRTLRLIARRQAEADVATAEEPVTSGEDS